MKSETMTIIDEFIQEGKDIKTRTFTINLIEFGNFTNEQIALLAGVEIEFVREIKAELEAEQAENRNN